MPDPWDDAIRAMDVNNADGYRLWVNEERTVLVRMWLCDGKVEVATRETPAHIWSPPITMGEERVT